MSWLGLIGGIVIGALGWGWSGAVVLGFLGWLAGIIVGSFRKPKDAVPARVVQVPELPAARMERIEKRLAAIEVRLLRMESGQVAPAAVEAPAAETVDAKTAPEPERAEIAEPAPEPLGAPAPEPEPSAPAPPAPPPPPPPERKPNPIIAWFTGGNTIVRVGAVVLFVGLVFLLNYAREHRLIAPEYRVAGVTLFAVVLLVLGWRLRARNMGYAVSLQGAGVAILYLTIFAAMRLYGLVSHEAAFFLLAAVAVFSAIIAITQESLALAVIGAGGGFLAPILASTGAGSHVALFGYYLVLNVGIAAIAWFRAWRALNVLGLVSTVLIALAWGERFYRPELFATTEPFLVAFFLLYVAIAILFARAQRPAGDERDPIPPRYVDGTIVFGTPLAAFGLQAGLTKGMEFGLAYSSLAAAALYLALAGVLYARRSERWALLAESFLALGVVFATLAIPLALDARWTSAAWSLEGAAIVWVGIRQRRTLARAFGLLLELLAGLSFLYAYQRMPAGVPLADAPFVGAMLLALAGLWTNRLLVRGADRVTAAERSLAPLAFIWGLAWLLFAGHHEIESYLPREMRLNAHAAFFAATAAAFAFLSQRLDWREARWPGLALLPVLWVIAALEFLTQSHAFAHYGWLAWPAAIAIAVGLLRAFEAAEEMEDALAFLHASLFLLVAGLGAWELHWVAARETAPHTSWTAASVLVVPALLLLVASSRPFDARWPVDPHKGPYRMGGVLVVLIGMAAWVLYANATHDGTSSPLPYLPLLNAIDLGHALIGVCIVAAALAWRRSGFVPPQPLDGKGGWVAIGVLAFIWLNAMLLRSLHHWADIPYTLRAMTRSMLAQAALSIFWAVLALALMVLATRTARRPLWMVGAGLMGVVVVKLFLVDLDRITGIERIVSFIAVGLLMLVIGWFSPVPPRKP